MIRTDYLISLIDYGTVLAAIPGAVLCYIPMKNQRRHGNIRDIIFCGLLLIFGVIVITQIFSKYPRLSGTVGLVPFLGIFFVYYAMSVRAHVSQCAGTFLVVCAMYSIPSFVAYILDATMKVKQNPLLEEHFFVVVQLAGILVLSIPMMLIFARWGVYLIDRLKDWLTWFVLAAVSAIIFAIFSLMAPQEYELIKNPSMHRTYVVIFCLIAGFYLLFVVFFLRIGTTLIRKEELQEQETVYRMQSRQYQQLQDQTEKLRVLRHDFKHSIGLIQGLAEQGDMEGIQKYLQGLAQAIPQQEVAYYCDNELINTILNYYADKARAEGTKVKFLVDVPSFSEEQTIDLVSVLGNLLDNAQHGCATVPEEERHIKLRMASINAANLYIIVSNSFNGVVRKDGDRYLSTRRRRGGRGVGLRSIQLIAEKYGGEAKAYHEGHIFTVDVTMKIAS